ncbi:MULTISPECIES: adenylate/guanylate cyclase domain-containing protein [unclassified Bradyrhizobium]|uniref:adenylate/guanylate cyclase domain-containing protein n=1 Tax=unclassified Bradyrhizobium TaxID=2631580 RepID=UPI001BAA1863|nr:MULTISPECIES: adenylate/guanylate cyclase domain-containing protein [unclassified Bradyrhizobium]MBR1224847.1 GAF domain-containing protein [Bradyrhizobium sp. AUGA SZCCT0176]MBR1300043.1 GAF domain-containing protein [Bradyrhizobium sp. AUGA SZCCT0042]
MNQTIPVNEPGRLVALTNYAILDTLPEAGFDEITELAAQICGCPAALVSFVDASRQWIKAKYGPLPAELSECPREISICTATICNNDILYIPDLIKDQRFNTSPLVTGDMHIRFYCGVPLITQDGYALGTLCVIAFEPRELTFGQQEALRRLAHQTMVHLELRRQLLVRNEMLRELERARDQAVAGKAESDKLLLNILPSSIAAELKANDRVQPRFFDSATVMLIDFTGFTRLVETMEPASVIDQLDQHFTRFDDIMAKHRLEKLKTIGDAYLAVGGVPEPNRSHAIDAALAALQVIDHLARLNRQREKLHLPAWQVRIGINTGPVIAGVVGKHKFTYDIWGNTVNITQRVEAAGAPGRISIAESTWQHIKTRFETDARGAVEVKHQGLVNMYYLNRIRPELSSDPAGITPNDRFWKQE